MAKGTGTTTAKLRARIAELEDENRLMKHAVLRFVKLFTDVTTITAAATNEILAASRYVQ